MEKGRYRTNGGINFLGLLTILFIGLKLAHIITWSWWLVLSPLFILPLIYVLVLLMVLPMAVYKVLKRGEINND